MKRNTPHLFIFGLGYVGTALALEMLRAGWTVRGTTQSGDFNEEVKKVFSLSELAALSPLPWAQIETIKPLLESDITHVLSTVPPTSPQDPILTLYKNSFQKASQLSWIGYLSTTGVYGDHQGAWVDETSPCHPIESKNQDRLKIEQDWQQTYPHTCIFRLSGIYGPERNTLISLKSGKIQHRILKQNHVFCRIHLEDIVKVLKTSLEFPLPQGIFNVTDDCPAPQSRVIEESCDLLQCPYPPIVPIEEASLSPQAEAFYRNSRRICAKKIKEILKIRWKYPSYKEGLRALASV